MVDQEDDIQLEDPVAPASTIDLSTTGLIEEVPCPSNGSCAEEFGLNGRIYSLSCALIDPRWVDLDSELGLGRIFGRDEQANAVLVESEVSEGSDNDVIAVSAPEATGCSENPGPDAPTSPWRFAFGVQDVGSEVICALGLFTAEERVEEGCEPG